MEIRRIRWLLSNPVEAILAVLTLFVCLDVLVAVFFRYVLQHSLSFYDELARFAFMWMTFLGAATAVRRRTHFSVALFIHKFPEWLQKEVSILLYLIMISFAGLLLVMGIRIVRVTTMQTSPAIEISMGWFYGAVPVSAFIMLVYLAHQLVQALRQGFFAGAGGKS